MGADLQRGTVQAAKIAEPALSAAIRSGGARPFADVYGVIAPEFANIIRFATQSWLQKNPATAKELVGAIYATARWANANPSDSAAILAYAANIDVAVVRGMPRAFYATSGDPTYGDAPLQFAARYGLLARLVTAAELIATGY